MASIAGGGPVYLEAHEHYVKQTYRNRTSIYGANGKLDLVIPVQHKDLYRIPITGYYCKRYKLEKIHWRSIESAYRKLSIFRLLRNRPERSF
jgi:hypothetical protein